MIKSFKGLHTALITPFTRDAKLDEEGLRHLIRLQLKANIDGILLIGSTGESPTLSKEEKKRIIIIGREEVPAHCALIIGTGSYSTQETIVETQLAHELGADAALVVIPYYNRPSQEGLYLHYQAITQHCPLPIIIYNIPGRTGRNLQVETLMRLASIPTIVGIKDCSGDMNQMSESIIQTKGIRDDFTVLSGDDSAALPLIAMGGDGLISVASNLFPMELKQLVDAAMRNDIAKARDIHNQFFPLFKALFVESNPMPIKWALQQMGLPSGQCRLPLCELAEHNKTLIRNTLQQYLSEQVHP